MSFLFTFFALKTLSIEETNSVRVKESKFLSLSTHFFVHNFKLVSNWY